MARETYQSPAERTDDLSVWTKPEEVDARIRDLPAAYGLLESDLGTPQQMTIPQIIARFQKPENPTQKQEAANVLKRLQLVVLNLMLHSSGHRDEEPVTSPVKEWPMRLLVGDDREATNFGNVHQVSRIPEDNRYHTPVSPGEGWCYRMVDFEDNFLHVARGLRFMDPNHEKATAENIERVRSQDKSKWAQRMVRKLMG